MTLFGPSVIYAPFFFLFLFSHVLLGCTKVNGLFEGEKWFYLSFLKEDCYLKKQEEVVEREEKVCLTFLSCLIRGVEQADALQM